MKKVVLFCFALIGMMLTTEAAIWRVNNMPDNKADFLTLGDAVEAATGGDIIYVEGTGVPYDEGTVTINKPLTIYGPGFFLTENEATQANPAPADLNIYLDLEQGSEGSILSGLNFTYGHLYVYDKNITIERCRLSLDFRISATQGDVSNLLIKQCFIFNNMSSINISYNSSNLTFENNIFYESHLHTTHEDANYIIKNNIFIGDNAEITAVNAIIQNNIVYDGINAEGSDNNVIENNIIGPGNVPISGSNNIGDIDFSTVFVDYSGGNGLSTDGRYILKEDSPAKGHGIGGIDCGVFDGDFPYVLSGLPPQPHIFKAEIPSVGTSQGLIISVEAKSQN